MVERLQSVRGMPDLLPEQSVFWQKAERMLISQAEKYGYRQIRFPIVEPTQLFKRSVGEATDVVEKEMYTFEDRNGDSLTLRPEGTAGCVRAGLQSGILHNQIQRLWYYGPMFRHERPQKGRQRQFYQFGLECFGIEGPEADAEMIMLMANIFKAFGVFSSLTLQINSLGTPEVRKQYRGALVAYFEPLYDQLDEDSKRRLTTNPLRILDSKNPEMAELIAQAPKLDDYFDDASRQHFDTVKRLLDQCGIAYKVNPALVRGLDYYCHTVFEWVTDALGAQGTVCAGGRYDGLVEQLGGKPTPAVGCAFGLERIMLVLEALGCLPQVESKPLFYVVFDPNDLEDVFAWVETWRGQVEGAQFLLNHGGGQFKKQFKRADKADADFAVVLGAEELQAQTAQLKPLKGQGDQQAVALAELPGWIVKNRK